MTEFLAELVTRAWAMFNIDYHQVIFFRQVTLIIAPFAAGEWVMGFRPPTFFTRILQSIDMTAFIADDKSLPTHGFANSIFAISEVMGFVVKARRPDVGMVPRQLCINTERIWDHKKQKARCW